MLNRRFHFSLTATILTIVTMSFMCYLGFWQLDRAAQKEQRRADFEQGDVPAFSFESTKQMPDRYTHVRVRGSYVGETQILMDAIPKGRSPGYLVLTPFRIEGGDNLLIVNRGWRPWTGPRQDVNGLDVTNETLELQGRVDRFWQSGLTLGRGNADEESGWPRIVIYPRHEELSRWLNAPLLNWQLLLNADATEGFVRDWKPGGLPSERHVGYAVQWFALAVTALIIYLVLGFRRTTPHGKEHR